jgi:hypothetical protein
LNADDPGDEVFRRYRYQATYAAILALGMNHRNADIVEVFAEHHDDVLLKMRSGRFTAVQVKTQQPGGDPFKSGDAQIIAALSKFIGHERTFGNAFERYIIVTNHQFFKGDNKSSLHYLIDKAREAKGADPADMDSRLSAFINSLLKNYNDGLTGADRAARSDVLEVLRKLHIDDSLPKLEDIHQRLRDTIVRADGEYRTATFVDLERAAKALAYAAYLKSSNSIDGAVTQYLAYAAQPEVATIEETINQKRFTREELVSLLAKEMSARATLTAAEPIDPALIPKDLSTAEKKMTAGGLSATTVAASRDWRASAEHLQRQWAMKYQERPAIERYHHVAVAVQTACAEAHEATRTDSPQGPPMLESLKEKLQAKRKAGTNFFDCEEEHLLGHAVIRTDQCKVWWSPEFHLE